MKNLCEECKKSKGKEHRVLEIYLCDECKEFDKYQLICKTDIKNEYDLLPDDLDCYENYIVSRNRYPDMTLYKLDDILDVFCSYHKIDKNDKEKIIDVKN